MITVIIFENTLLTILFCTGRIMVGLRWWNYVDDDGVSHWVYESRKVKHCWFPLLYTSPFSVNYVYYNTL